MRKAAVLKHLPNLKNYRKELKQKIALIGKLDRETEDLENILTDLEGVTVHNDFPLALIDNNIEPPGVEVFSACDDTTRYAYASRDSDAHDTPERWRATGYKEEGATDGRVLVEGATRLAAVRAAKDYVAGTKSVVVAKATSTGEAPKKRGRKPKASA